MGTCPPSHARELTISIVSDGDEHSVLVVKVYQTHHMRKDKLIGGLTGTIDSMLAKLKDGSTNTTSSCVPLTRAVIIALEEPLCNSEDTSSGIDLSGFMIKFAFSADTLGAANAYERQAMHAVTKTTEVIAAVGSTAAPVGILSSAIDIGAKVVTG